MDALHRPVAVPPNAMDAVVASACVRAGDAEADELLAMINSAWVTQVIRTACVLRLPDRLSHGAADSAALAAACACQPEALHRLLLAMSALQLCTLDGDQRWHLAPRGACLCRDAVGSLHHWALHAGGGLWQRLAELPEAVRTGASWPERHHGVGGYARLADDPQAQAVFHHAMVELTHLATPTLLPALQLDGVRCAVDVGGGRGELLCAVLAQAPAAHGVLFDQPAAVHGAQDVLNRVGVAARCRVEPGDFFAGVPAGADLYLLKSVLHNWDDASCVRILAACHRAMADDARLIVIERARPALPGHGTRDREVARTDLNMLVSMSGKERSADEYRCLLQAAGLQLTAVREAGAAWSVLEAQAGRPRPGVAHADA